MSELMNNVKTINSVVRTMIFLGISAGLGFAGFVGFNNYIKPGIEAKEKLIELELLRVEHRNQSAELDRVQEENDRIKTSMRLLKVDRRKAKVEILEKSKNEDGEPILQVRFTEFDEFDEPIGAGRDFELRGDRMYVDCWVVKFGDKYVEQADALRSASLCVFKGIYGNLDGPEGSQSLDSDSRDHYPVVYSDAEKTAFESKIWNDFWQLANDRKSQQELGIRAIHGQANYLKVEAGKTYEVTVRSSGAASLTPVGN